jgi:hypothetical protein
MPDHLSTTWMSCRNCLSMRSRCGFALSSPRFSISRILSVLTNDARGLRRSCDSIAWISGSLIAEGNWLLGPFSAVSSMERDSPDGAKICGFRGGLPDMQCQTTVPKLSPDEFGIGRVVFHQKNIEQPIHPYLRCDWRSGARVGPRGVFRKRCGLSDLLKETTYFGTGQMSGFIKQLLSGIS